MNDKPGMNIKDKVLPFFFLLLVFFTSSLLSNSVSANTLYVAPDGSDNNPGSETMPFATLARAKVEVRSLLQSPGEPINVIVKGGVYYLDETLTFDPSDSGNADRSVTYSGAEGETAVLSGGRLISPVWSGNGNIRQANIGSGLSFDQLFLNGALQVLARYPNYDENVTPLNGFASDAYSSARINSWSDPAGGFIRGLHNREWGGNSYRIDGKSGNDLDTTWVGDNNRGSSVHSTFRMVENIFEELDAPGEWFYEEDSGTLYFYAPSGVDLSDATFVISTLEELIKVQGTSTSRVQNLNFDNFTFQHTHRTLFTRPYERPLRSDWGIARAGAVFLENAENISVTNSDFSNLGGNVIFMSGYNRDHLIHNNDITDAGASAILSVGLQSAVRDPSTWDNDNHKTVISDTTEGPLTDDYPKDIVISENYINNIGMFEKQSAGVQISMAESIIVRRNTIHEVPRAGINIGEGTWGGHLIEHNDVWDTVLETSDHGAFNSWGRDRYWSLGELNTRGINGLEKQEFGLLDAWKTTVIRNNRVNHSRPGWALDFDDGSSNYEVYNNLLLGGGIKLREGFARDVYNNVLINDMVFVQLSFSRDKPELFDRVENNITINDERYSFVSANLNSANTSLDRNVFWNDGPVAESGVDEPNSVSVDPLFVDPDSNDYTTQADFGSNIDFNNFSMTDFGKPGFYPRAPAVGESESSRGTPDPEPLMGAIMTSIYDTALRSALGAPSQDGITFQSVPAASYAASQGLMTDDTILSINGTAITTKNSFWQIYNLIPAGETVSIILLRQQMESNAIFVKTNSSELINSQSSVVVTGGWRNSVNRSHGDFQGDVEYTRTNGDFFEFSFNGIGVEYITENNSDMGDVEIYIDDQLQGTVSANSASRVAQQVLFRTDALAEGVHTLRGVKRNGEYLLTDAFRVLQEGEVP